MFHDAVSTKCHISPAGCWLCRCSDTPAEGARGCQQRNINQDLSGPQLLLLGMALLKYEVWNSHDIETLTPVYTWRPCHIWNTTPSSIKSNSNNVTYDFKTLNIRLTWALSRSLMAHWRKCSLEWGRTLLQMAPVFFFCLFVCFFGEKCIMGHLPSGGETTTTEKNTESRFVTRIRSHEEAEDGRRG